MNVFSTLSRLSLFLVLAALAGCNATSSAVERPLSAEAECARFGYQSGTRPFAECVTDMRQQAHVLARARR